MKLTARGWLRSAGRVAACAVTIWLAGIAAQAQAVSTTTVQGTVYLANGQPAGGTLVVSWPTFTTAAGQLISAGHTTVTVGADGFVSVNLAPNQGATPAGEYYTTVFYKSDGTVSTEYWVVPAATQASLAQVQAQVMPAAEAVQAVSKAYVDQAVSQALGSQLSASGGNLTGPLFLSGDPSQPLQAADKHYVDSSFSAALPLSGGTITGPASFSAAVTFGSSVTASSGIGFTGTGAAQTLANLLPGAASDSANGMTLTGTSAPNALVPKVSPVADVRAYGAKIDGATDIGSALSSAMAACNGANGNSCTVLLPCAGPSGCYLANGSSLSWSGPVLQIKAQGTLHLGSTLVLPDDIAWKCDGGATDAQFQFAGAVCSISGPNVNGTLGTATTTTGSAVTFTPTYTSGSASNFQVNSAITVAGIQTCSATATRTSASHSANTVFTLSRCTDSSGDSEGARVPIGATLTVTGCSDATFNVNATSVIAQDWPNNTESVYESGATSTATGCTVTGFDDNTFETVSISAVSGGTMTATFAHKHAASDIFGMVAVTFKKGTYFHHDLQGVAISSQGGAALWMDSIANINLSEDSFGVKYGAMQSIALESDGSWQGSWDKDSFLTGNNTTGSGCTSNCVSSYPYSIRFSQDAARNNGTGVAFTQISNSTIDGGIKIDGNGMNTSAGVAPELGPLVNDVFEETALAAVTVDPRFSFNGSLSVSMTDSILQDNFLGNVQNFVAGTDCCVSGFANLGDQLAFTAGNTGSHLANAYWPTGVMANGVSQVVNPASIGISTGILTNGSSFTGNFVGTNAWMSPAIVPQATLSVTTNPTCSTCSTVTGPDGVANSAFQVSTDGSGNKAAVQVGSYNTGTYAGDIIIFGAWCEPGSNVTGWGGFWGANDMFDLQTNGTDKFVGNPGVVFGNTVATGGGLIPLTNGTWQKCVQIAEIGTGETTTHNLAFQLRSNGGINAGNRFYDWFWMFVPGPNNPSYAGVTQQEAVRWAENVLKGYVPSSASTGVLYYNPALALASGTNTIVPANSTLPYVGYKTYSGTGTPADTCSATANAGAIEINATPTAYQCSNATGSYAWNTLNGGTSSSIATGNGLIKSGSAAVNAFLSNAVPPAAQYVPTPPLAYYPQITTSNCTTVFGLSNASGGGLVATTSGTNGTCTITLPSTMPVGAPWRINVELYVADATNNVLAAIQDGNGDYWSGTRITNFTTAYISGDWNGGGSWTNQYGFTGGIPSGTYLSLVLYSDGTNVCMNMFPDRSAFAGFGMLGAVIPYQSAWTGIAQAYCASINSQFSGNYTFHSIQKITLSDASTTSKIVGAFVQSGSWDGPADDLMDTPIVAYPSFPTEGTAANGSGLQIAMPDNSGNPAGVPLVFYHHPNANPGQLNYSAAQSTFAALVQDGYALMTMTGDPNLANYSLATSSNWGAPAGIVYRQKAIDYARAYFPSLWQSFSYSLSMGGLSGLNLEANDPGAAAIYFVSPATDLVNACNNNTGYGGFTSIIQAAYGTWWQAIAASTNQNPITTSGYWRQINSGLNAPPLGFYNWTVFTNKEAWASGTAYTPNQIVYVPYSGTCSGLSSYDPDQNLTTYKNGPPMRFLVGSSDTLIPPADQVGFCTSVASAAASTCVSSSTPSGSYSYDEVSGQAHLGSGLFLPTDVTTFFDTYRTARPAVNGAPLPNGGAVPLNACGLKSSGAGQFVAESCTGTGNSVRATSAALVTPTIGGGSAINAVSYYSTASITPTAVTAATCSDQTFSVTGLATGDKIGQIIPPGALGNVSVMGYASAANTLLLHFCNPSAASVTPPAGVYSFLDMR